MLTALTYDPRGTRLENAPTAVRAIVGSPLTLRGFALDRPGDTQMHTFDLVPSEASMWFGGVSGRVFVRLRTGSLGVTNRGPFDVTGTFAFHDASGTDWPWIYELNDAVAIPRSRTE